jgi:hypothetical protein
MERVKRRSPPTYNHHSEAALAVDLKRWEERVIEARKELQDFEDQQKDYMEDVWETYKVILSVRGNARHPHLGYDFLSRLDEDHVVGDDSDRQSTSISLGSDSETLTQNPSDIVDEPPAGQLQDTDATRKIKRVGFMALGGLGVAGLIGLIYVVVSKLKSVFKSGNKPEKDRTGIVRRSTLEPGRQEDARRVKSRLHSRHW